MAIIWNDPQDYNGTLKDTAYGRVLSTGVRTCVRIMSDVWADVDEVDVWTGSRIVTYTWGCSEFGRYATVEVDATPEVRAAAAAWRAEGERLAALAAEERRRLDEIEHAKRELNTVKTGKTVIIVARRGHGAPPKGTQGTVFWTNGARIGLKDVGGVVHWTAIGNVKVILADVDSTGEPREGWVARYKTERSAEIAALAKRPVVGSRVRAPNGLEGVVFWTNGSRVGVKSNPRSRTEEPVWAGVNEVELIAQ